MTSLLYGYNGDLAHDVRRKFIHHQLFAILLIIESKIGRNFLWYNKVVFKLKNPAQGILERDFHTLNCSCLHL
jgi:hypothetical protein